MKTSEILILTFASIVVVGVSIALFYVPESKTELKRETEKENFVSSIIDLFGKDEVKEEIEPNNPYL